MKYLMQRQLGFSLVEIMIGMTLGLFLTIGIIQLYIGSNRNYRFQEGFANTQANGRFALEVLNNSIRMTNFTGCSTSGRDDPATTEYDPIPPTVTNVLNTNTDWWKNIKNDAITGRADWSNVLVGYDGGDQTFPGKNFRTEMPGNPGDRIEDTDAIISLGGIGSYSVTAADTLTLTLAQIQKINGGVIQNGDLLWICDVDRVALFQVTNVAGTGPFVITHADSGTIPGNKSSVLPIISSPANAVDYVPTAFYIGVSAAGTSRSLYQIRLVTAAGSASMQAEEMVEGVENMQIFYGVDTNTDRIADAYMDASDVPDMDDSGMADWDRIVSVRIELLLANMEDNVLSEPQTYFFPNDTGDSAITGRTVIANDRRWYQTFSTTIGIRNRLN